MQIAVATEVHSAVSHALAPFWELHTPVQPSLHFAIAMWYKREDLSFDEYLSFLIRRLQDDNVDNAVIQSLQGMQQHPYKALDDIFAKVCAKSRALYEVAADWVPQDVELIKRHRTDPLYPETPAYGELGTCAVTFPRNGGIAQIALSFIPALLGPPSWASIPYLLFHELICHVSQASPMDTVDPFVEGWMDYVALLVHNESINAVFPWAPECAKRAARNLHQLQQRVGPGMTTQVPLARSARALGSQIAGEFRTRLATLAGRESVCYEFIDLSIRLNRIEASVAEHRHFISAVGAAMSGLSPALEARLSASIRSSIEDGFSASALLTTFNAATTATLGTPWRFT